MGARQREPLANRKGVHREVESEGSGMQNVGLTNRNRMRGWNAGQGGQSRSKSNSCTEGTKVDAAGINVKVVRLTRGDLTDGLLLEDRSKTCREGSAEGIVVPPKG